MSNFEWEEVSASKEALKGAKCSKCGGYTTGAFNEVTQQCLKCHMEEMS